MKDFLNLIRIQKIFIRYHLADIILSAPKLKAFKPLLYLMPWHYFKIDKYNRAQRLRLALEELGPIFIKFGQTLSTRRDLLPADIGDELAKLQDSCASFNSKKAVAIIEKSLGGKLRNFFQSFDEKPLASASIAQVHSAKTLDGDEVIVKVLRPNIEKEIKRDISLLYKIAKITNKHPDGKRLRPMEVVKQFEQIISKELNMLTEAANASLLRNNFKHTNILYIPKVNWDLTKRNILVMERIYGTPINDIKTLKNNNADFEKLAKRGVEIFFTQVFKHNFFHADMHPGNIFIGKSNEYIGVDFGIMGYLSDNDLEFIAKIFLAFFNRDYKQLAKVHLDAGWVSGDINELEFENTIRSVCEPIFNKPLKDISFGQVLINLFKEAQRYDIYIQPQLFLFDKTLLNIEGLGRELYPELDLWDSAKPFLEKIKKEKFDIKKTINKVKAEVPEFIENVPYLPNLVLNTLDKINKNKLNINYQNKELTAIKELLSNNSKSHTYNILAGASFISTSIFLIAGFAYYAVITTILTIIFIILKK